MIDSYRVTYDFFSRSHDGDDWISDQRWKHFPTFEEAKQFVENLDSKGLICAEIFEYYAEKKPAERCVRIEKYDFI